MAFNVRVNFCVLSALWLQCATPSVPTEPEERGCKLPNKLPLRGNFDRAFNEETPDKNYLRIECDPGYELIDSWNQTGLYCEQGMWNTEIIPACYREVAFQKPASTSNFIDYDPNLAVDGLDETCTKMRNMNRKKNPTWGTDLFEIHTITYVTIKFGSEALNVQVRVLVGYGSHWGLRVCAQTHFIVITEGEYFEFRCEPNTHGSFIKIETVSDDEYSETPVVLCTVRVYSNSSRSVEDLCEKSLGKNVLDTFYDYCLQTKDDLTFDDAANLCRGHERTLATHREQSALTAFITWKLALKANEGTGNIGAKNFWISAQRNPRSPRDWIWPNGKRFISGHRDANLSNHCMAVIAGFAESVSCDQRYKAVCLIKPIPESSTTESYYPVSSSELPCQSWFLIVLSSIFIMTP